MQENGLEDESLFDSELIYNLDFSKCSGTYNPTISPINPGENLKLRSLKRSDYDKGYMQLLTHLTVVGDVSREQFEARFSAMRSCPNSYFIIVIEDTSVGEVIGSATLAVEQKFIRGCKSKGRVEDVVVSDKYRGKQLGKLMVDLLTLLSPEVGCFKAELICIEELRSYYANRNYQDDSRRIMFQLVDILVLLSQQVGCYKVSLECKDKMVPFYSVFGFIKEEGQNYMCRRF